MKTRKTGKLKAFTIMELVVAMLISSIVVSIAYAGFRLVSAQLRSMEHHSGEGNRFLRLNQALQTDLDKSARVIRQEDGFVCERGDGRVRYQLTDTAIIRWLEDGRVDSFGFKGVQTSLWFEGEPQDRNGQLVDALHGQLVTSTDSLPLYITKAYDRQTLFYLENKPTDERY